MRSSPIFALVGPPDAFAVADPVARCARAKVAAAGAMADAQLGCQADAATIGDAVDGFCLADARGALLTSFQSAEAADGCATVADGAPLSAEIETFTGTVAASHREDFAASLCAAARMEAAGRHARRTLRARSRAALNDKDPAPGTLAAFENRLRRVFTRADRKGDCQTATTADATIATSDSFAIEIVGRLIPHCGDDILAADEQCDGTDSALCTGLCQADCTCPEPVCGNDVLETGEECDGAASSGCTEAEGLCGAPGESDACQCCGTFVCSVGLSCCGTATCLFLGPQFAFGFCIPESCSMPSDCPARLNMTCENGECCAPSGAVCALEGLVLNHCCPGLTCTGTSQFSTCQAG